MKPKPTSPFVIVKKFRCSRGHEWAGPPWSAGSENFSFQLDGKTHGPFCLRCLVELLREQVGIVKEVKDGT
jgi:hypothetical protein